MSGWKRDMRRRKKIPPPQKRIRKLNVRKEVYFKYDLNKILEKSDLEDGIKNSLMATLLVISTRKSIDDAKKYLQEKVDEGVIGSDLCDRISSLLDRYAQWR
ncbi:MAG: hypothetical protein J7L88_02635 [Thermoplasmata archaeon]|nr:hypothetical protein [Thermoplasmata archaeon]